MVTIDTQLPTPPNETDGFTNSDRLPFFSELSSDLKSRNTDRWNLRSSESNGGSSVPSPPTDDPPDFEDFQNESLSYNSDPLIISTQRFDYPDPSNKASPTSSNEADVDVDTDLDAEDPDWDTNVEKYSVNVKAVPAGDGTLRWESMSNRASPSYSDFSDLDPFTDANTQKHSDDNAVQIKSQDHGTTT